MLSVHELLDDIYGIHRRLEKDESPLRTPDEAKTPSKTQTVSSVVSNKIQIM